jgi:hypothetical protein
MADRDLANRDAELAQRAQVIPGLDARLACIDAEAGADSYHVLQGLRDPEAEDETSKCCYFYQRFGSTGTRGAIELEGPMEQPKVARLFAEVFREKTGSEPGAVKPGDRAKPGKFWLQQQATPDLAARWEYYVSDGVDGKATGWYPYEPTASEEVEELYSQHVANARESRTATRVVSSGYFKYQVDLDAMKQTNQRTKKVRNIRRAAGDEPMPAARAGRAPALVLMKAMKATRTAKARTTMRAMKAAKGKPAAAKPMKAKKKISKYGSRRQVWKGTREKTRTGLTKSDLMMQRTKGKSTKIVSKKRSAAGKNIFEKNLAKWVSAFSKARAELGVVGFQACKKGTPLYEATRRLYDA